MGTTQGDEGGFDNTGVVILVLAVATVWVIIVTFPFAS